MAVRGNGRRKSAANGASQEAAGSEINSRTGSKRSRAGLSESPGQSDNETTNEATSSGEPAGQPTPADSSAAASADAVRTQRTPPAEQVAVAAYYLAERRGFSGDQQVEDWLAAERALAAEFAGIGDDEAAARGAVEEDIQPDEVEKWAETLHVTPEQLRVAIQRVGPVSSEVRKFLQESQGR